MLFRNENPILGSLTQVTWTDGSLHYLVGQNDPNFSSATPSNLRALDMEPVLSATSVAITGSVAAVRGNTTISAGTTVTSGYVYGIQGKLSVPGTASTANFMAGVVGQLDLSATVALSGGPVSAIWGDMGATMSSGANSDAANLNVVLLTNTTGTTINSAMLIETKSTYLFDLSNATYSPWYHNGAPTTLSGSLKVNTPDGARYIALYTTV